MVSLYNFFVDPEEENTVSITSSEAYELMDFHEYKNNNRCKKEKDFETVINILSNITLPSFNTALRMKKVEFKEEVEDLRAKLEHTKEELEHKNKELEHKNKELEHKNKELELLRAELEQKKER
jgi:peptidoglycan hydrolase CwlO-like protein